MTRLFSGFEIRRSGSREAFAHTRNAHAFRYALAGVLAFGFVLAGRAATDPIVNSVGMKLMPIPAGNFVMGSEQKAANWDEQPRHRVTISRAFYIAETEVTAAQYRQFKADAALTPTYAPSAAGMSWADASAYCAWLTAKEGRHYRLPTEAEWEYVSRAGRDDTTGQGWESKPGMPNPWGVRDLFSGPVEWCSDWYGEYGFAPETDPVGRAGGFTKVVRGGLLHMPEKPKLDPYLRPSNRAAAPPAFGALAEPASNPQNYGLHCIGFRVVLAPESSTSTVPETTPYARVGVKQSVDGVTQGPDSAQPYFRRRRMLPLPPEDPSADGPEVKQARNNHAGLHPSFRHHSHSPGFAVLPNGDAMLVIYTSYWEYEPEVSLISARLRFGADEWDMPSPFLDTPGANDHAPLLWQEPSVKAGAPGKLWLFWGHPYAEGHFPFNYVTSEDNGATWSAVRFPRITGPLGTALERPQPINTVIRDAKSTTYLAVDAAGGGDFGSQSMLWATADGGATWHDTLGRTAGRHTSFVLRRDGSILGLGGKNSGIDDFMPRSISRDGGQTYAFSKTPFSQLNSGQRPCIIRLASGRLFMAGDYQPSKRTKKPDSIKESGSYVALSDDDGETWRIKRLPGAYSAQRKMPSVGYCVARQAPNGVVHLITSCNGPALHYEMNEAWIRSDATFADNDARMDRSMATKISAVAEHREDFPDGKPRIVWSSGVADDGRVLLHGRETWYFANGKSRREAQYELGRKVGRETIWTEQGIKQEEWNHREDGVSEWTTYWPDGSKRSESHWRNHELISGTDQFYPYAHQP